MCDAARLLMVFDGINDARTLTQANIRIGMHSYNGIPIVNRQFGAVITASEVSRRT